MRNEEKSKEGEEDFILIRLQIMTVALDQAKV